MGNMKNNKSEHMINSLSRAMLTSLPRGRCLSSQGGVDHRGPMQRTKDNKLIKKLARN